MPEFSIEPLPPNPHQWEHADMWAWVNRGRPVIEDGLASIGWELPILASEGSLRPVSIRFERPRLVKAAGYSWENHLSDEMLTVSFLHDRIFMNVVENLPDVLLARLVPIAGIVRLADDLRGNSLIGDVPVSLGDSDWGKKCLAFSSQSENSWLIPDPYFFLTHAYADEKSEIAAGARNWSDRKVQLYWRGAPSGLQKYADHSLSQRVRLVMQGAESNRPEWYNVRFASLGGIDEDIGRRIEAIGGLGTPEPQMNILEYRYNLDVDGWSCAWTGLFIKLLAASPVLKIQSDLGFRQWYYDQLVPWRNFVPVAADLSNLEHCLELLEARPDIAEQIGIEGERLATSLSFESQLDAGAIKLCNFQQA